MFSGVSTWEAKSLISFAADNFLELTGTMLWWEALVEVDSKHEQAFVALSVELVIVGW